MSLKMTQNKDGSFHEVVKIDQDRGVALLRQIDKLTKCLMYGGVYSVVNNNNNKHPRYLTLDAAIELYNKQ